MSAKMTVRSKTGVLFGDEVNCSFHMSTAAGLPAGEFRAIPPMYDPIYGSYILLVPSSNAVGDPHHPAMDPHHPAMDPHFVWAWAIYMHKGPANLDPHFVMHGGPANQDTISTPLLRLPNNAFGMATCVCLGTATGGTVFVLTPQIIPGRNCLVVYKGFQELSRHLSLNQGAEITVVD